MSSIPISTLVWSQMHSYYNQHLVAFGDTAMVIDIGARAPVKCATMVIDIQRQSTSQAGMHPYGVPFLMLVWNNHTAVTVRTWKFLHAPSVVSSQDFDYMSKHGWKQQVVTWVEEVEGLAGDSQRREFCQNLNPRFSGTKCEILDTAKLASHQNRSRHKDTFSNYMATILRFSRQELEQLFDMSLVI